MPQGRGSSQNRRRPVQRQYGPEYRDKNHYTIAKEATAAEVLSWLDKQCKNPTVEFPMVLRDTLTDCTMDVRDLEGLQEVRDGWKGGM